MTSDVIVERDVEIELVSGAVLRADLYLPADRHASPALLQYTAYNKANRISVFGVINPMRAVPAGFAVVVVDALNRFQSGGDQPYRPFVDDGEAAADVIDWIAAQPWSTGAVGMYGASNNGVPQWQSARRRPAALRTIVPHFSTSEFDEGWVYRGGAFQLGFNAWWTLANLAPDMLARAERMGADVSAARQEMAALIPDADTVFERRPDQSLGAVQAFTPHYDEWLAAPPGDPYWQRFSILDNLDEIELPVLHIAGWYNVHLDGNIANYLAMRHSGPESVRDQQHLVIGPWTQWMPAIGDICGPEVRFPQALFDMEGLQLAWFGEHLAGGPRTALARARVFVMGVNEWRDLDEWPASTSRQLSLLLSSGGSANTRHGDGTLGEQRSGEAAADSFVFDPADPVPTLGGATMLPSFTSTAGPRDQSSVEDRDDVLVFTSAELTEPITAIGPVTARLYLTSSAPSVDIIAKLVDVYPDGRAMLLCDGIVRTGERGQVELVAGTPTEVEVDLIATANVFLPGHRVRLEIAASNFPKFDRHARRTRPGAAAEPATDVSTQTLHHDDDYPSALLLTALD
jgi:putative CocE/NonD family hydrolase